MVEYAIVLFAAAIALAIFAMLIAKGHTNLINCYRENSVTDKEIYCKKISQSLWVLAVVMVGSGVIGLLGETDTVALCAVGVLIIGVAVGLCRLFRVQNRYGGGIF